MADMCMYVSAVKSPLTPARGFQGDWEACPKQDSFGADLIKAGAELMANVCPQLNISREKVIYDIARWASCLL